MAPTVSAYFLMILAFLANIISSESCNSIKMENCANKLRSKRLMKEVMDKPQDQICEIAQKEADCLKSKDCLALWNDIMKRDIQRYKCTCSTLTYYRNLPDIDDTESCRNIKTTESGARQSTYRQTRGRTSYTGSVTSYTTGNTHTTLRVTAPFNSAWVNGYRTTLYPQTTPTDDDPKYENLDVKCVVTDACAASSKQRINVELAAPRPNYGLICQTHVWMAIECLNQDSACPDHHRRGILVGLRDEHLVHCWKLLFDKWPGIANRDYYYSHLHGIGSDDNFANYYFVASAPTRRQNVAWIATIILGCLW